MISGGFDGKIKAWNATGAEINSFDIPGNVNIFFDTISLCSFDPHTLSFLVFPFFSYLSQYVSL
jgi:hypothetical protein